MSEITPQRLNIHYEETQFRSAVSESVAQKLGGSINFINDSQYVIKEYFINGPYNITGVNETFVDGLIIIRGTHEIVGVSIFSITPGSGGTTTLDVLYATTPGGSFTSIFSTKPAISFNASHPAWIQTGGTLTNAVAPVMTTTPFQLADNSALRVDFFGKQTGSPENCGLLLYTRPV